MGTLNAKLNSKIKTDKMLEQYKQKKIHEFIVSSGYGIERSSMSQDEMKAHIYGANFNTDFFEQQYHDEF